MSLAINSYNSIPTLADGERLINLAMTFDERDFLSISLNSIILRELQDEICNELTYVDRYFVKDPYGEEFLSPSVQTFFSKGDWSCCITCAAGVNSLLPSLARLAAPGPAYIIGEVLPDFPFWINRSNQTCVPGVRELSVMEHARVSNDLGASLIFFERPSLREDRLSDLSEMLSLCTAVLPHGTIVIVDESNANYYPPTFSMATLIPEVHNLIVLRGLSKAYLLGGLRLAYSISSNQLRERVREVIPPLLVSSLSLKIGKAILAQGDITGTLRQRIEENKAAMRYMFETKDLCDLSTASEYLPYILLKNTQSYIGSRLEANGIIGKFHSLWSGNAETPFELYRLSVPLRTERMTALNERLENLR